MTAAVTDEQINRLRAEAGAAGDASMADTCRIALGWTDHAECARVEARATCAEVIEEWAAENA